MSCHVMPMSCLCVTFTSWSTPSFGVLLSNLSNRNTHLCTFSIRMISFFTLQCEFFTSCNVSNNASLASARTREGGVVNQMWTGLNRGRGVPKNPKFLRTSFMDDPIPKSRGNPLWLLGKWIHSNFILNRHYFMQQ